MLNLRIRSAVADDAPAWLRMRRALWPELRDAELTREVDQYLTGKLSMPLEVLIACDSADTPIGFAELSIRSYAEGCETDRVGYLEAWYVVPEVRREGVGRALVAAAQEWALAQGCTEFGSDAELDNDVSAAAHRALGFEETARIRCFRKVLRGRPRD